MEGGRDGETECLRERLRLERLRDLMAKLDQRKQINGGDIHLQYFI